MMSKIEQKDKKDLCIFIFTDASVIGKAQLEKEVFYTGPTSFVAGAKYDLTGTENKPPCGFPVLESTGPGDWALPSGDSVYLILTIRDHTFGNQGFWAPQIFKKKGEYFLTHTANEQTLLTSPESILGPFKQKEIRPIDASSKHVDSYIFQDAEEQNNLVDDPPYAAEIVELQDKPDQWIADQGDDRKTHLEPCPTSGPKTKPNIH